MCCDECHKIKNTFGHCAKGSIVIALGYFALHSETILGKFGQQAKPSQEQSLEQYLQTMSKEPEIRNEAVLEKLEYYLSNKLNITYFKMEQDDKERRLSVRYKDGMEEVFLDSLKK